MIYSKPTPVLLETIARLAPGTALRDGLERILRGRTGALIVLGHDDLVEGLCDGGFALDVSFAPTRLRELAKMDGAIVLTADGTRILRANVQMVPDPKIPTEESGTRHRAAERTAIQTGYPVVSVSASMSIVSVYVGGVRHVLEGSPTILSRANQAVATLERYKARLDEVSRALAAAEVEDFVSLRDAMTVVQRLEMVRRISVEIEHDVVRLGVDGRQIALQLKELLGDTEGERRLIVLDYLAGEERPTLARAEAALDALDELSDADLLHLNELARTLGYAHSLEVLDSPVAPRGYRLLSQVPRLQFAQIDRLVGTFGSLQSLLAATSNEVQAVDGIGGVRARHITEGLTRLAEAKVQEQF